MAMPEFVRRAIEAQGKVSADEVQAALDDGSVLADSPVQEALPLEPVCPRCGGVGTVWSYESDQDKPCPECA